MTGFLFDLPDPFTANAGKKSVTLYAFDTAGAKGWLKTQSAAIKTRADNAGFTGKAGQILPLYHDNGALTGLVVGLSSPVSHYDIAIAADWLKKNMTTDFLKGVSITLDAPGTGTADLEKLCIGWGWAAYQFTAYKKKAASAPIVLAWPKKVNKDFVRAQVQSVCLLRNLINTPSNDLGTEELEKAARSVATKFKAKINVIADKALLKQNFPMIYAVGRGSPRRPRLVDMTWGDAKAPKVTIVGKGIVFDTGGLDIKPPAFMTLMKKDMGGAAHALALAWMIMAMDLPVRLRVLLPIAENSVDGDSFRPGDVLTARNGLTVEIGDTDAEGRLVLGDALVYGAEGKPDLMINFATLTGAARIALGPDIPAIMGNKDDTLDSLRKISFDNEDPMWPLPMHAPYWKDYGSKIADMGNDDSTRMAGAIKAGLFLQKFAGSEIDWVHVDCYAWTNSDRPGRPFGGADTGFRAVYKLIEKKFG